MNLLISLFRTVPLRYLFLDLNLRLADVVTYARDKVRWGVWLGRHIC